MLAVLTIGGRRYPMGPVALARWPQYLHRIERVLGTEIVMERGEQSATVRSQQTGQVIYTITLEPWPTEAARWG